MIPIKNPEEVLELNLKELYIIIEIMKQSEELAEDELELLKEIEQGTNLDVPLLYLIEEWYEAYPSSKKVIVKGYGKYNIEEFYKEIRERETKMRTLILNNFDDEEITEPRG